MSGNVLRWPMPAEQDELFDDEKLGPKRTEQIQAPILGMGTNDLTRAIVRAIRDHYDGRKHAVKDAARLANTNTRTSKNWLEGKNMPNFLDGLRLVAQIPELKALVLDLIGADTALPPTFERKLHELMRSYWQWRDGPQAAKAANPK